MIKVRTGGKVFYFELVQVLKIFQIENAPALHYNELETDVKELQSTDNVIKLKELEIKRLKEETKLKKWEVWVNVTSSMQKASKWFGLLFGD